MHSKPHCGPQKNCQSTNFTFENFFVCLCNGNVSVVWRSYRPYWLSFYGSTIILYSYSKCGGEECAGRVVGNGKRGCHPMSWHEQESVLLSAGWLQQFNSNETTLFMQFGGGLAIIKLQIFSTNCCHFSCQAEADWNSICINQQYQDLLMCSYLSQVTLASFDLGPSCSDNNMTYKHTSEFV